MKKNKKKEVINGLTKIVTGLIEAEKYCQTRDAKLDKESNGLPSWKDTGMH